MIASGAGAFPGRLGVMRSILLAACAALLAGALGACGSDTLPGPGEPCGASGACAAGLTRDPRTNTCLASTRTPDARVPDAGGGGGADAKVFDAGGGGNIDAATGGADARQ